MLTRANCAAYLTMACVLVLSVSAIGATSSPQVRSDESYTASAPVTSEPQPVRIALAPPTTVAAATTGDRNISLDFHGADITDVLKALSVQAGKNIVTGTDVKGTVTVTLNKVAFGEALDMITKLSGYTYAVAPPDTYIVGTVPGVGGVTGDPSTGTISATIALNYADPDQVTKLLEAQLPGIKGGSTGKTDQAGPKVLVVSGPKAQVDKAVELVSQVEQALSKTLTDQASGKVVEIYKLKYADAKTTIATLQAVLPLLTILPGPTAGFTDSVPSGVTFTSTSGGAGSAGSTVAAATVSNDPKTIVLSGSAGDVAKAKDMLGSIDIRPKQVLIETKWTDITVGAQKRLGLTWSWTSLGIGEGTTASGGGSGAWKRLPFDAEAQLDAMLKDNSATLLANPTVASLDSKPATIFIGDEIKYIINIQQTLTGVTFQTETASVGVTLRVIARPDTDGYITLALHPEVSTIKEWLSINTGTGGNNSKTTIALPNIARRYTDHIVRVKDGETIVIGGLIRDSELNTLTKVPLLGDLPFFGGLFRHREKQKEHSDITVFIKASLMKDS